MYISNNSKFILSCLLLFILVGCGNSESRLKLQQIVISLDKQCPIKYDYATCISARLIDDDMVINYIYDESIMNLDVLTKKPDFTKRFGGSMLFNESGGDELVNLLITSGCGFKAIYKGSKSQKETIVQFTNDEIKEIRNNPQSKSDMLDWQIDISNSMLPQQVDDITELVCMEKDETSVYYVYSINEDKASMDQLKANKEELTMNLRTELTDQSNSTHSTSKPFLKLIRKTGKSLKYVYKGHKSGKSVIVEFSNDDLREIANDYILD